MAEGTTAGSEETEATEAMERQQQFALVPLEDAARADDEDLNDEDMNDEEAEARVMELMARLDQGGMHVQTTTRNVAVF